MQICELYSDWDDLPFARMKCTQMEYSQPGGVGQGLESFVSTILWTRVTLYLGPPIHDGGPIGMGHENMEQDMRSGPKGVEMEFRSDDVGMRDADPGGKAVSHAQTSLTPCTDYTDKMEKPMTALRALREWESWRGKCYDMRQSKAAVGPGFSDSTSPDGVCEMKLWHGHSRFWLTLMSPSHSAHTQSLASHSCKVHNDDRG